MRIAANSSTSRVVTPGCIKEQTSFKTAPAIAQAGRIASKSGSLFKITPVAIESTMLSIQILILAYLDQDSDEHTSEPPTKSAFLQKPIIMAHEQVSFHLPHRVQEYADHDQHTRTTEKRGHSVRYVKRARQENGNYGNDRQKNCASQCDSAHRIMQVLAGCLARPHSWNVAAILFQIIGNLQLVELGCHPKIREKQD